MRAALGGGGRSRQTNRIVGGAATVLAFVSASPVLAAPAVPQNEKTASAPAASASPPAAEGGDLGDALQGSLEAVVLPTRVVLPRGEVPAGLRRRVANLDVLLTDTAQDLGLLVDLSDAPSAKQQRITEDQLAELARNRGKVVILPILRIDPDEHRERTLELRIVAAAPGLRTLRSRVDRVAPNKLTVRAVVMLRDVVSELATDRVEWVTPGQPPELAEPVRSMGRAILAVNATLYGGYMGYSLQRASGSEDPRLLYPLIAVGAGVGLGAAIIIADEWDVGVGDAWYLAAGAWWPAVASHLIIEGRFGDVESIGDDEAWSFGLVASTVGLGLSAVGLLHRGMGDGGAALAHSGGGIGMFVGGLAEIAYTGSAQEVPLAGFGYGAAAGWLVASATAINYHPPATDVMAIDLGLVLGGLAGAAAASPLLFEEPTAGETRAWVASTGAGMIGGGTLAWYLSVEDDDDAEPEQEGESPDATGLVHRWGWPVPTTIGRPFQSAEQLRSGLGPEALPPATGVSWRSELW